MKTNGAMAERSPKRLGFARLALSVPALMLLYATAWAQPESGRGTEMVAFDEITPGLRSAVDRGLQRLAFLQAEDGSFGGERYGKNVGITALAGVAFMADGNLPGRGPYGSNVERTLQFVLNSASESGLIAADASHGPMYGHGFATLFLGEVYGMMASDGAATDQRVREALLKAVRLIVISQNHEGGWRYHPVPFDADLSVTICQVMALRSARNAGLSVPKETVDLAIAYVRACQNPADGGFRYMVSPGGSAFPRSAGAVAALFYAGIYEDKAITDGLEYLDRNSDSSAFQSGGHHEYGLYYAAQAMFLAGGDHWREWFPRARSALLASQQPNGSWQSSHGEAYGTAMALLVLQVTNRLLPIFQR